MGRGGGSRSGCGGSPRTLEDRKGSEHHHRLLCFREPIVWRPVGAPETVFEAPAQTPSQRRRRLCHGIVTSARAKSVARSVVRRSWAGIIAGSATARQRGRSADGASVLSRQPSNRPDLPEGIEVGEKTGGRVPLLSLEEAGHDNGAE